MKNASGEPALNVSTGALDEPRGPEIEQTSSTGALAAPSTWPSYTLLQGTEVINIDSQADSQEGQPSTSLMQRNASEFADCITEEENARELAFARAAGDVDSQGDREECANGGESMEGEASATASTSEGQAETRNEPNLESKQTNLTHWLM